MAANQWDLNIRGMDQLLSKLEKIPDESEAVINQTLKKESSRTAIDAIDTITPVSKKTLSRTHPKHAKGSNAYRVTYVNLGFKIRPTKKFNYVKYPDLGIGTSAGSSPKSFMRNGLDRSVPRIKQQLLSAVEKIIMK